MNSARLLSDQSQTDDWNASSSQFCPNARPLLLRMRSTVGDARRPPHGPGGLPMTDREPTSAFYPRFAGHRALLANLSESRNAGQARWNRFDIEPLGKRRISTNSRTIFDFKTRDASFRNRVSRYITDASFNLEDTSALPIRSIRLALSVLATGTSSKVRGLCRRCVILIRVSTRF
jgi:hypothetical protein